jgi:hypothetical protein
MNASPHIAGVEPDDSDSWYLPGGGIVKLEIPGRIYSDQEISLLVGLSRGTVIAIMYQGDPGPQGTEENLWAIIDMTQLMNLMEASAGTRTVELKAMIAPGTGVDLWEADKANTLGFVKDQDPPGGEEPVGEPFIDGVVNAKLCGISPGDLKEWIIEQDTHQCQLDVSGRISAFGAASVEGGVLVAIGGHPMSVVYHGTVPQDGVDFSDAFQFVVDDVRNGNEPIPVTYQPIVGSTPGDIYKAYDQNKAVILGKIYFEGYGPDPSGEEPEEENPFQSYIRHAEEIAREHPWAVGAGVAAIAYVFLVRRG